MPASFCAADVCILGFKLDPRFEGLVEKVLGRTDEGVTPDGEELAKCSMPASFCAAGVFLGVGTIGFKFNPRFEVGLFVQKASGRIDEGVAPDGEVKGLKLTGVVLWSSEVGVSKGGNVVSQTMSDNITAEPESLSVHQLDR